MFKWTKINPYEVDAVDSQQPVTEWINQIKV